MEDKKIAELFKIRDERAVDKLDEKYGKLLRNLAFKVLCILWAYVNHTVLSFFTLIIQ